MSKSIKNNALAILCSIALLFAVAVTVEAQTDTPILDDELVASVQVADAVWIVPVALQPELELYLGQPALVEPMGQLLSRLAPATPSNSVRIEGAFASPSVQQDLVALGYRTEINLPNSAIPGAGGAQVHRL